jgi:hypothetical protein
LPDEAVSSKPDFSHFGLVKVLLRILDGLVAEERLNLSPPRARRTRRKIKKDKARDKSL